MKHPTIAWQRHYGVNVWTDVEMDQLRRKRCMCLTCGRMTECAATTLYDICKSEHIAVAVTRCPDFVLEPPGDSSENTQ